MSRKAEAVEGRHHGGECPEDQRAGRPTAGLGPQRSADDRPSTKSRSSGPQARVSGRLASG